LEFVILELIKRNILKMHFIVKDRDKKKFIMSTYSLFPRNRMKNDVNVNLCGKNKRYKSGRLLSIISQWMEINPSKMISPQFE